MGLKYGTQRVNEALNSTSPLTPSRGAGSKAPSYRLREKLPLPGTADPIGSRPTTKSNLAAVPWTPTPPLTHTFFSLTPLSLSLSPLTFAHLLI